MTSRRMIAADMFEDDTICSLPILGRLIWIGIIVACADDQGRMMDNPAIIRANVFPTDETITDTDIENTLSMLYAEGKITRYVAGKKRLIQIVNWWRYQTPSWAMPSKYPPPEGWTDREKYHTPGVRDKVTIKQWDMPGGYQDDALPIALPIAIDKSTNKINLNKIKLIKEEEEEDAELSKILAETTKLYHENMPGVIGALAADELKDIAKTYSMPIIRDAFKVCVDNNGRTLKYLKTVLQNMADGKDFTKKPKTNNSHFPQSGTPVADIPVFHAGDQYDN